MATGLQIKVGADTTEFKQEIRQLPKEFQKAEEEIAQSAERTSGVIGGIFKGLMTAGTLVGMERLINHFDKVADAASKYGETAEDIQRVGVAAEMTGGNIDTVAMAMERAGVAAAKAARGNEEFIEKFNRAGIDAAAFSTASLTERVEMVARAQQEAGTAGDRHASILEALGRGAASIDFQRIADEMGNVTVASEEAVERLSQANDRIENFKNRAMVFGAEVLNFFGEVGERIVTMGIAMEKNPLSFSTDFTAGATLKELKEIEERYEAIRHLRETMGNIDPSDHTIDRTIEKLKKLKDAASRPPPIVDEREQNNSARDEAIKVTRQEILRLGLLIKEAEAAGNAPLIEKLRHQQDIEKGILKYKHAEDAYGMAVREANAELAKRANKLNEPAAGPNEEAIKESSQLMRALKKGQSQELARASSLPNSEKARQQEEINHRYQNEIETLKGAINNLQRRDNFVSPSSFPTPSAASLLPQPAPEPRGQSSPEQSQAALSFAQETTLQRVAGLLESLNTKLPQPVLV